MKPEDITANVLTGGALAMVLANIESIITIAALLTATIYNCYRIWKLYKEKN